MASQVNKTKISDPPQAGAPSLFQPPIQSPISGGAGSDTGGLVVNVLDRNVTYYKLTSSDIILLGFLGTLGSILLACGGIALGFYFDIHMTVKFSTTPLPKDAQVYKDAMQPLFGWISVVCFVLGVMSEVGAVLRFWFIRSDHVTRVGNAQI